MLIARCMESGLGREPMPALTESVFSEPSGAPWLDVPAFDYYDPFLGDCLESNSLFHCHIRQDPWE
jgi:hypothetical protein